MLTIRAEQMRALAAARAADFERGVLAELRAARPGLLGGGTALEEQVRQGIARGRAYFDRPRDLARYVFIVLEHLGGWSAERDPAVVREIVGCRALPGPRRLDNLERWARRQQRRRRAAVVPTDADDAGAPAQVDAA
jgi:hypothetical protein